MGLQNANGRSLTETVQVGHFMDFGASGLPAGYLACDGSVVAQASYPALYSKIGTTWGPAAAGNFTLPDFRRRVRAGAGGSQVFGPAAAVGSYGGEEGHANTAAENGPHSHSVSGGFIAGVGGAGVSSSPVAYGWSVVANTTTSGSGTAHNTFQPTGICTVGIKY